MKKVFLALAAIMISTGAFAQGFDWGIKAGLNVANLTNTDNTNYKPSIYAGAFAEFNINYLVSIQPEVLYSRQGFKFDGQDGDWLRLNYLNIPILCRLYVLEKLSFDIGPQFGILLNSKYRWKDGNGDKHTSDVDNVKNFDVSIPVGLTYQFIDRLDAHFRYNIGITKVWDSEGGSDKPKNSVFQIGLGWRF